MVVCFVVQVWCNLVLLFVDIGYLLVIVLLCFFGDLLGVVFDICEVVINVFDLYCCDIM